MQYIYKIMVFYQWIAVEFVAPGSFFGWCHVKEYRIWYDCL